MYKQKNNDNLGVYVLNVLPEVSTLQSLLTISLVKVEMKNFSNCYMTSCCSCN